ncbi:glucosamine--fructose-6-phosphate aminotransferase (isomerizing) [Curtobacterium sp. 320]|jgi:glucosamine--fructose-6-phosphate aminotransferase (isomerizing)|uniref:glutamine--fructose-6-phosphate transaminase (isomerizing) n=1 Tax=unclassified Curtobacterium TaxID=257496 RepID=UPI00285D5894|nr:glutamine--fructose-6-phosphate transaminase (isomerizing) [Curtobacterium sp. 320]MDR6574501.1 glucosamine--fructose-6-phosphate aminotransferase (isomerizing) [Curtobacterium sp. 320]
MCGIIAARVTDDASPYLLDGLERLEYRGYDSAGIAVRTAHGGTETIRSVSRVGDLRTLVAARSGDALTGVGIGHTRWATHGVVREANAHPHADCSGRISIVHNGIVENADRLRATLERQGHVFSSDVDSEVIAHLVERALAVDPDLMLAVQIATAQLEGSWAIVVLDARDGRMVVAAERSPLVVARSARGDFVASDIGAIAEWCETFVALRDGDVVELGEAWTWSSSGVTVPVPFPTPSPFAATALDLGDHPDHMAKEIEEQPEVVASILDRVARRAADGSMWVGLGLPGFHRLAIVACGTSLNAGQVIATALRGIGGVPTDIVVASEADQAVLGPGTLVVAISQSGETADVLRALDRFEDRHPVLALTNNVHSSLARRADAVLDCHAGPEIGVAATKTFTAQVVVGVAAVISALVASGRIDGERAAALVGELSDLPARIDHAAAIAADRIPLLVSSVKDATGFLFLGRGAGLPYAAEGALKLKELSYRWAEAYPAGELKHGPLALVDEGTPVVVIDHGDHRLQANIAEVRARGGFVITIGGEGSDIPALGRRIVGDLAWGRATAPWGPLEAVVPLQMLARELALQLGCDVDKPRNLAKSVTVE